MLDLKELIQGMRELILVLREIPQTLILFEGDWMELTLGLRVLTLGLLIFVRKLTLDLRVLSPRLLIFCELTIALRELTPNTNFI